MSKPEGVDYYFGIEVGDGFGGYDRGGCDGLKPPAEGDLVAVAYSPGAQADANCPDYLECVINECSASADDVVPEDLSEWDLCAEQCVTSTSSDCEEYEVDARFSGQLRMLQLNTEQVAEVLWAGTVRELPPERLFGSDCRELLGSQSGAAGYSTSDLREEVGDVPNVRDPDDLTDACPVP